MNMRRYNLFIIIGIILLVALITGGVWYMTKTTGLKATTPIHSEVKTIYYCPMHPNYTSDKPGQCPICGMNLVPMKTEEKTPQPEGQTNQGAPGGMEGQATVTITPERQQLIGVKKAVVKYEEAQKTIRTVGKVAFDPDLAVAQREYIEAVKLGDKALADAARQRLTLMGMDANEIKALGRRGTVDKNLYLPGKTAWVYPVIYENELPFVKKGESVKIELPAGGNPREGVIRAIDSVIDPATRTARLHIEVPNQDATLRPNMFVNATIQSELGKKLLVPKDAVIDSGQRKIVFVIHEGTQFMPHEVKLGAELADSYVVESGLKEGDEVATAANFLIDAESRLKAALGGMGGMEGMNGHKH